MHSRRQREQPQSAFGGTAGGDVEAADGAGHRPGLRKVRVSPRTEARRRDRFEPQRQIGDALGPPREYVRVHDAGDHHQLERVGGQFAVEVTGVPGRPAILGQPRIDGARGEIGLCCARRQRGLVVHVVVAARGAARRTGVCGGERREFGSRVGDPARTDQGRDQESPHLQALVVQVHLPEDLGRAPVVPDRVAVARGLRVQAAQVLAHHRQTPTVAALLREDERQSGVGLRPEEVPVVLPEVCPRHQRGTARPRIG